MAVVIGGALGFALGGRATDAAEARFRAWWLLPVGVGLQAAPSLLDVGADRAFVWVAASYLVLSAFVVVNLHLVGMPVVLLGLAMNVVVIGLNQGMPVRTDALLAVGATSQEDLATVVLDSKHHLETGEDRLTWLGDIIPVRPTGEILSFGDLVLAVGTGNVIFRVLKPARRTRTRGPSAVPSAPRVTAATPPTLVP